MAPSTSQHALLAQAISCRVHEHATVSQLLRASNVKSRRDFGCCPCVCIDGHPLVCSMLFAKSIQANESARHVIALRHAHCGLR